MISSLYDNSFNKKHSSTYGLSALVSEDRFCFMVLNAQQELLLLREYHNQSGKEKNSLNNFLKKIFQKDDLLHLPFGKINLAVYNQRHALVPARLFIENEKRTYLEKIIDLLPDDKVLFDNLKSLGTQLIYAVDEEDQALLSRHLEDSKLFHGTSALLTGLSKLTEYRTGNHIYVNIQQNFLHITLFDSKELLFCNIFSFGSSRDVLYSVMLVYDQFNLEPENVPLYLSGLILKDSEIYQLFFRYIRKIQFLGAPEYINFGPSFQQIKAHYYFDLFSLALCE